MPHYCELCIWWVFTLQGINIFHSRFPRIHAGSFVSPRVIFLSHFQSKTHSAQLNGSRQGYCKEMGMEEGFQLAIIFLQSSSCSITRLSVSVDRRRHCIAECRIGNAAVWIEPAWHGCLILSAVCETLQFSCGDGLNESSENWINDLVEKPQSGSEAVWAAILNEPLYWIFYSAKL